MEMQRPQESLNNFLKEKLTIPDFRSYVYSNQDSIVSQQKNSPIKHDTESRNRPTHIWETDFDAGAKATQWIENSPFNKWCNNNWISMCN